MQKRPPNAGEHHDDAGILLQNPAEGLKMDEFEDGKFRPLGVLEKPWRTICSVS